MKYKLLKKIEGVDWEIGDIKEGDGSFIQADYYHTFKKIDIHNLLLNGTIEKVEENKGWRAECGNKFYYIDNLGAVREEAEMYCKSDDSIYEYGNYFRTKEQAQEVADKIKQILKESHERN